MPKKNSAIDQFVADNDSARVSTYSGISFTEYSVTGPLLDVLEKVQEIFLQWSPHAYGTYVRKVWLLNGDTYEAQVWRGNSGD